jgi:hypothetical protein
MARWFQDFYGQLGDPLLPRTRIAIALAVIPLALATTQKLWTIHFMAPQYPKGLVLEVYPYTIAGGNEGVDLSEINTLNHYVGMKKLDPADFADLDFLPFAMGILAVLALRVAAIGDVRALLDLAVLTSYFGLFSFGRFVFMLYNYGHDLDPRAPITLAAFMPPILGSKQMANFTVESWPALGTGLMGIFGAIVLGFALWHTLAPRSGRVRESRPG